MYKRKAKSKGSKCRSRKRLKRHRTKFRDGSIMKLGEAPRVDVDVGALGLFEFGHRFGCRRSAREE